MTPVSLESYQIDAIYKLRTGSILCGGVGTGKSRTAIMYYIKDCGGSVKVAEKVEEDLPFKFSDRYRPMTDPRDLYIITTAKKRDSQEWLDELAPFCLLGPETHSGVKVTVDSWNNIGKYKNVYGAFFIFDEQRVVGSGAWVKAFLNIARKNKWILLSATPGDTWSDYIPVFVANGFFRNKTDFNTQHCVFSRFSKYPKIERYVGERVLEKYRDRILVKMEPPKKNVRIYQEVRVDYDFGLYRTVMKDRWDVYENRPIKETGKLLYLIRRVVNSDPSRLVELGNVIECYPKVIVFYNYNYELELMLGYLYENWPGFSVGQWNGRCHERIPVADKWVYLVQYSAGCEGWNCIETNCIVFYSQTYSYRMFEQACGRIDRMNTSFQELVYYQFVSRSNIDLAIRRALKDKKNFNERSFIGRLKDG